jgi:hypothetical protein
MGTRHPKVSWIRLISGLATSTFIGLMLLPAMIPMSLVVLYRRLVPGPAAERR